MAIDAIIVSGGRGQRLGGIDKGALRIDGITLLERTVAAVDDCRDIVIAGSAPDDSGRAIAVREDPPFGGPAAGIVAALDSLAPPEPGDRVIVLACDLVHPDALVAALASAPETASVVIRDADRLQYLAGIHDALALREAAAALADGGVDASVRALLGPLNPVALDVPEGTAADIDTWHDAALAGVAAPDSNPEEER